MLEIFEVDAMKNFLLEKGAAGRCSGEDRWIGTRFKTSRAKGQVRPLCGTVKVFECATEMASRARTLDASQLGGLCAKE